MQPLSLETLSCERDADPYWLYLELRVHELAEMFAALSVFLSLFLGWVSTVPRCSCVSDGQGSSVRVRVNWTSESLRMVPVQDTHIVFGRMHNSGLHSHALAWHGQSALQMPFLHAQPFLRFCASCLDFAGPVRIAPRAGIRVSDAMIGC